MTTLPLPIDPLFRIQVLLENEPDAPTNEFRAGDLVAGPTFDSLVSHLFAMSKLRIEDKEDYDSTFKYRLEEKHSSRWVNFEDTRGFGYAIQSNHDKGYVFISACIVKKGAKPPPVAMSAARLVSPTKTKVAKKAKPTKAKVFSPSSRGSGEGKLPVEERILSSLKELLDLGIIAPPIVQIALFCGYSNVQSASFKKAMKNLVGQNLIEYPSKETVSLTSAGADKAPSVVAPATTNEQVQDRLKQKLKDKAPLIFEELADGLPHVRSEVAASVGYSNPQSAGFKDAVKQMMVLSIVEHPDGNKKFIQLTDIAFPFGRPGDNGTRPDAVTSIVPN